MNIIINSLFSHAKTISGNKIFRIYIIAVNEKYNY